MPDTYTAWGAISLASFLTLGTRLFGPIVMGWLPMSARVERFLQNLSLAVLAALVASMLARGGGARGGLGRGGRSGHGDVAQVDLGHGRGNDLRGGVDLLDRLGGCLGCTGQAWALATSPVLAGKRPGAGPWSPNEKAPRRRRAFA